MPTPSTEQVRMMKVLHYHECPMRWDGERYVETPVCEHHEAAAEAIARMFAEARAEALMEAAAEQERLSTDARALGSKAVQFKRLIFANWLRERAILIWGVESGAGPEVKSPLAPARVSKTCGSDSCPGGGPS